MLGFCVWGKIYFWKFRNFASGQNDLLKISSWPPDRNKYGQEILCPGQDENICRCVENAGRARTRKTGVDPARKNPGSSRNNGHGSSAKKSLPGPGKIATVFPGGGTGSEKSAAVYPGLIINPGTVFYFAHHCLYIATFNYRVQLVLFILSQIALLLNLISIFHLRRTMARPGSRGG